MKKRSEKHSNAILAAEKKCETKEKKKKTTEKDQQNIDTPFNNGKALAHCLCNSDSLLNASIFTTDISRSHTLFVSVNYISKSKES